MSRRGQVVLLAAGVCAVALVGVLGAYLQVAAPPPDRSAGAVGDAAAPVDRYLESAVGRAATGLPASHAWADREAAGAAARQSLRDALASLNDSRVEGALVRVSLSPRAATAVAASACPRGPRRQFGNCTATGGVVLQERAGRTHLVGAAVEVRTTSVHGAATYTLTVLVRE